MVTVQASVHEGSRLVHFGDFGSVVHGYNWWFGRICEG
jgi:hypothetical protein